MALLFQHPLLLALIVALIMLLLAFPLLAWWLGAFQSEHAEVDAGIEQLRSMSREDFLALIVRILKERGMEVADNDQGSVRNGLDLSFTRGNSHYLMQCRNQENQHISVQNIAQMRRLMEQHQARGAILVTCGRIDAETLTAANQSGIRVMAGKTLWEEVKPWIAQGQLSDIRQNTNRAQRNRLLRAALFALLPALFSAALALALSPETPLPSNNTPAPLTRQPDPPSNTVAPPPSSAASIARLGPEQLAARRATALMDVRGLSQVAKANWDSRFTVHLHLHEHLDGPPLEALVQDICRALLQHEELRYTRLQIDVPPATADAPVRVRWRQCQ